MLEDRLHAIGRHFVANHEGALRGFIKRSAQFGIKAPARFTHDQNTQASLGVAHLRESLHIFQPAAHGGRQKRALRHVRKQCLQRPLTLRQEAVERHTPGQKIRNAATHSIKRRQKRPTCGFGCQKRTVNHVG